MALRVCRTSQNKTVCTVVVGRLSLYTLKVQLVDELDEPLSGLEGFLTDIEGNTHNFITTASGRVEVKQLPYADSKLALSSDSLIALMEQRRLRLDRKISTVKQRAEQEQKPYHYAVVGELCDAEPDLFDWEGETLPVFHFPNDKVFPGFNLSREQLNKEIIIEVCPFRAWNFVLEPSNEYSVINAYNLGILSNLAYLNNTKEDPPVKRQFNYKPDHKYEAEQDAKRQASLNYFFAEACLDLDSLPRAHKEDFSSDPLVKDVPFRQRYKSYTYLSSSKEKSGALNALVNMLVVGHSTQLFCVVSDTELIIAWRGTETSDFAIDLLKTDMRIGQIVPMLCNVATEELKCEPDKSLTDKARVHRGFMEAFNEILTKETETFREFFRLFEGRKVFVAGHSLGGALAFLYASTQREHDVQLYTYGMPRVINKFGAERLEAMMHYRHINENDLVASIPLELVADAEFGNWLGPFAGLFRSVLFFPKLLKDNIFISIRKRLGSQDAVDDEYWHHGKIINFTTIYTTRNSKLAGPPAPTPVKLYVIPHLDQDCTLELIEAQRSVVEGLKKNNVSAQTINAYLGSSCPKKNSPEETNDISVDNNALDKTASCTAAGKHFDSKCTGTSNPPHKKGTSMGDHSMSNYVEYICFRLLEFAEGSDPEPRFNVFAELKTNVRTAVQDERLFTDGIARRNRLFMDMDDKLHSVLSSSRDDESMSSITRFLISTKQDEKLFTRLAEKMNF
jgi:hypothetical protein